MMADYQQVEDSSMSMNTVVLVILYPYEYILIVSEYTHYSNILLYNCHCVT